MWISDRFHHDPDAEGEAGGLRGPHAPRARRLALIGAVVAALSLVPGEPAAGHSLLIAASPGPGSVVSSVDRIALRFNNRIEKALSSVRLVGGGEGARDLPLEVTGEGAEALVARVPPLSGGAYRVEWQVLSTDGHVVSGRFSFRVEP